MTDNAHIESDAKSVDDLQTDLEAADAADAPAIAERLAFELASDLEGDDEGASP